MTDWQIAGSSSRDRWTLSFEAGGFEAERREGESKEGSCPPHGPRYPKMSGKINCLLRGLQGNQCPGAFREEVGVQGNGLITPLQSHEAAKKCPAEGRGGR